MQTPLTLRRGQRAEYDRRVDLGVFQGEPIDYALRAIVPPGWIVRLQAPVSLDDESEPEPVVLGHPGAYRESHPALAVEVAESSLDFDRTEKGSLYARAAVPDYWIVNLVDGVVEVYRDPEPDASAAFGWRYRSINRLAPSATVVPVAFSEKRIAVADLLPNV